MKSLKELEDKRASLVEQGKALLADETRDLDADEDAKVAALADEVRSIEAEIEVEKSKRTADAIVETREATALQRKQEKQECQLKKQNIVH